MERSVAVINVRECQSIKEIEDHIEENSNENEVGDNGRKDASYWNSLYALVAFIPFSVIISASLLIPRKNSIIYQEYWYEGIPLFLFGKSLTVVAYHILSLFNFTRAKFLLTVDHFAKVFIISGLFFWFPTAPLTLSGLITLDTIILYHFLECWFLGSKNLQLIGFSFHLNLHRGKI